MRVSTIFGALFATAAVAAPLAGNVKRLDVAVAADLEATVGDVVGDVVRRDDVEDAVPAGGMEKRLDISGLVGVVDGLLNDVLGKVGHIEATVLTIVGDVENVDVEGVLSEVEGLVDDLLAEVQDLSSQVGVDLELGQLNPLLATVTAQVQGVVSLVDGLVLQEPAVVALVSEVKGTLANVLSLLGGVSL